MGSMLTALASTMAVLTETTPSITADQILQIVSPITATFSIAQIVLIISGIIGVGIAFVFLWWGVRKAFRSIMGAVTKGRIKI